MSGSSVTIEDELSVVCEDDEVVLEVWLLEGTKPVDAYDWLHCELVWIFETLLTDEHVFCVVVVVELNDLKFVGVSWYEM